MNSKQKYVATSLLPASVEAAFAYHERPGALSRLVPPWESVTIERTDNSLAVGSRVVLKQKFAGVPLRWIAEHTEFDPPNLFADTQVSGPFAAWDHRHEFVAEGDGTQLRDCIDYQVPFGSLGKTFGSSFVRRKIETMFAYRHRVTRDDLALRAQWPSDPLKVAISGSSGLVGRQLGALFTLLGHNVKSLVRTTSGNPASIAPWSSEEEAAKLADVDAVVHLAGRPIAEGRWTPSVKDAIRSSRVALTRQLCESLARLDQKPDVLVCASATGFYGDRRDEVLDERSEPGDGFLPDVTKEWEDACRPAIDAGIRVVNARLGVVLSSQGGALTKMLLPAKFGGGAMGSGQQWWSWIALDDAIGALYHAVVDPAQRGPVNYVAPEPIRNADLARTLGNVLGRPAIIPAPAFAIRTALGEMADALLLASVRVIPTKLIDAGYQYRFSDLGECLRYSLGKERKMSDE